MKNYRLYVLDEDNDVLSMHEIVRDEDDQAILQAASFPHDNSAESRREIWQGGRLVKVWRGDQT